MKYALAYDIGTTGVKTCLFEIDDTIRLIADAPGDYNLYILEDGGAEQDPDEWTPCAKQPKRLSKSQALTLLL